MDFWVSLQMRVMGDYCNIGCQYCSYGKTTAVTRMSDEVLEGAIRKTIRHNGGTGVFCWHGGEPTLVGLDFFEKAVLYQTEAKDKVVNQIQTNGIMIDSRFARFFKHNRFGVGLSLDGPAFIHDRIRVNKAGHGTYHQVIQGLEVLRKEELEPSVIATVSKNSLSHARQIFDHLVKDLRFKSIHFSVVFESKPDKSLEITNEEWYGFLREIFHLWCEHGDPEVEIRELTEVLAWLRGKADPCCTSLGTCAHWLTVNYNGDVFPCEVVGKRFGYGNILINNFEEIVSTPCHHSFREVVAFRPKKCLDCKFQEICNNGCTEMRLNAGDRNPLGLYAYCEQRLSLFNEVSSVFACS